MELEILNIDVPLEFINGELVILNIFGQPLHKELVTNKNTTIEEGAHLGHGCIIHGATIGYNSMIGMNACKRVVGEEVPIPTFPILGNVTFNFGFLFISNSVLIRNQTNFGMAGQPRDLLITNQSLMKNQGNSGLPGPSQSHQIVIRS